MCVYFGVCTIKCSISLWFFWPNFCFSSSRSSLCCPPFSSLGFLSLGRKTPKIKKEKWVLILLSQHICRFACQHKPCRRWHGFWQKFPRSSLPTAPRGPSPRPRWPAAGRPSPTCYRPGGRARSRPLSPAESAPCEIKNARNVNDAPKFCFDERQCPHLQI